MTVQQLIDKLQLAKDKKQQVEIISENINCGVVCSVFQSPNAIVLKAFIDNQKEDYE
jgi:hypothetical protein